MGPAKAYFATQVTKFMKSQDRLCRHELLYQYSPRMLKVRYVQGNAILSFVDRALCQIDPLHCLRARRSIGLRSIKIHQASLAMLLTLLISLRLRPSKLSQKPRPLRQREKASKSAVMIFELRQA